jgi:hypothetical protein
VNGTASLGAAGHRCDEDNQDGKGSLGHQSFCPHVSSDAGLGEAGYAVSGPLLSRYARSGHSGRRPGECAEARPGVDNPLLLEQGERVLHGGLGHPGYLGEALLRRKPPTAGKLSRFDRGSDDGGDLLVGPCPALTVDVAEFHPRKSAWRPRAEPRRTRPPKLLTGQTGSGVPRVTGLAFWCIPYRRTQELAAPGPRVTLNREGRGSGERQRRRRPGWSRRLRPGFLAESPAVSDAISLT